MAERGRPTDYTPDLAVEICRRLAEVGSLRKVCRADDMPHESTVRLWAVEDRDGFYTHYAKAREAGYQGMADETLEIADDGTNDTCVDEDGGTRVNTDVIARSRLRVDTRKWLLSKVLPKMYGDRVTTELVGKDGGPIQTEDVSDMEAARRIAHVLARATRGQADG